MIFEVDEGLNTLVDYRHKRKFTAEDGEEGGKRAAMVKRRRYCPESSGRNRNYGSRIR